jgi:hypothetical protein
MVNCGSSIVFITAPRKLNFSSLLELWAALYNATNMVLLRKWGLFRPIMSNYPQGSSTYLLLGSPTYNRQKEVYVLSLTRLGGRGQLKCDGTRTETGFPVSVKRTSPFKSARGASVQSTTGSRGVRISGSNAGYTPCSVVV